jgi:hypothetical protein
VNILPKDDGQLPKHSQCQACPQAQPDPEHPEIVAALDPPSRASVTGVHRKFQISFLFSLKPQALRII